VLARVQKVWELVVGPAIAAAANPTAEHTGTLTVTCTAAVWAQELDLMSEDLIPRLNAALGEDAIRELRCRTG
jgi:predicted nucleic acid-binding Zn ribbon protein